MVIARKTGLGNGIKCELNKLYFFGRIFYTFTTLTPPVVPRTQKFFCHFGQKNIFFEDLIVRRFRKFGIE